MDKRLQHIAETLEKTDTAAHWKRVGIRDHRGIDVPLFSLHSKNSCGIGEYTDIIPLLSWCKKIGFDVIQLLPLNDTGINTSPYSAISAYALNPLHLSLTQLPYVDKEPALKAIINKLQHLNASQRVDYSSVRLGKKEFFREYYSKYAQKIISNPDFENFKKEHQTWLPIYALFKALKIFHSWNNWELWPDPYKNPSQEFLQNPPAEFHAEMEYHIVVQYLCFKQFEEVTKAAKKASILIKGDIPILINRDSADVWAHRHLFQMEFSAGAPPDLYVQQGQKWGFPIYNWDNLAAEGYRWWIERLKVASQFYSIYRIDHVVGFFRIWAIPLGHLAKEGHFVPPDKNIWIAHGKPIIEMMIQNCDMLPIGEDLGTVPQEVKDFLSSLGICGTKMMRWERFWEGNKEYIDPKDYNPESMSTVSTHDSPTLTQWWNETPEEAKLLAKSLHLSYTPELSVENRAAILHACNNSGSLFHINLLQEFLALIPGMTHPDPLDERINLPATISDMNWTYKFIPSTEEILKIDL